MAFVQMGATNRKIPCIYGVFNEQCATAWLTYPSMVATFGYGYCFILTGSLDGFHLAGKVSNQVAARYPGRYEQFLALWVGLAYMQPDPQPVSGRVKWGYAIAYVFVFHICIWERQSMSEPLVKIEV